MEGLATFALGSLAFAAAPSLQMLVAGKALVGIGAAAFNAATPALIRLPYPSDRLG